jgi:putative Holliday junction resolvase
VRILGIDYGDRRIGLAMGDTEVAIAMGLPTLERPGPAVDITEALRRVCREQGIQRIVVGLPVNMGGTHGERARLSLAFAQRLRDGLGIEVETCDERLTTRQADRAMLEGDLSRKKRQARVDRLAAQLLLQGYLDAMRQSR